MTKASDNKAAGSKAATKTAAEAQAEREAAKQKEADAVKNDADKGENASGGSDNDEGADNNAAAESATAPVEPQPVPHGDPNPESVAQGVNTAPDVPDAATPSTTLPDEGTDDLRDAVFDDDEDEDEDHDLSTDIPANIVTANELAKPSTQTADQLVGARGIPPVAVEGHVANIIAKLTSRESVAQTANLYQDLGMTHGDIHELTKLLNDEFGIHILPTERDNFLLVRDVYNMVKRKLGQ